MANWDTDNGNGKRKSFQMPGAKPHYNPDRPGQVEHISLDLSVDIPNKTLRGVCQIRLNPVRNGITDLELDAVNLEIASVQVGNIAQQFDYDGECLKVKLAKPTAIGDRVALEINYAAVQPQRGIYFVTPTEHYPKKPTQVWTQGEDEDSRYWFPCFDYPGQLATSEIKVRVPGHLMAISNGELVSTSQDGNDKIYHWVQREVHPSYLVTLAIGDFIEVKDNWRGIPVTYYVDRSRTAAEAVLSMGKTPRMIEFFSQKYGYDYAFPKYAQVCVADFIFGGMENTSTTLLTDRCVLDERAALDNRGTESLVAHELAHQWFGDLVVIKHWSHAWVKEGAATYAEVLWTEHEYGAEEAAYYRLGEASRYFTEDAERYRRPMVTHVYREAIELYDRHIYEKGGCVYHMLRTELGDDLFWQSIHTFVRQNAHKTVETIDLIRAIEQTTGRNVLFLFDQYVFRGGHPEYKVGYSWDEDNKLAKVTVAQTQEELFDLKIPIAFGFEVQNGQQAVTQKTFTVRVFEKEQAFYFPLETKPSFISFDRGNNYLKQVTLEYGLAELKAGLQFDPDPLAKIQCAQALAKKGNLEAVKALEKALLEESFWGVRVEVADALAAINLDQACAALVKGLGDKDARVRKAVISGLSKFKTESSLQAIKPFVRKGDPSYLVEAAAATSIGEIAAALPDYEPDKVIKWLREVLKEEEGWNEVVRSGAIAGLAKLKESDEALDIVMKYTAPDVPQPLRLASIRALGAMGKSQTKPKTDKILNRLQVLASETFFLTQVSVVSALGQVDSPAAIGILQALADGTPDGRVRRMADEAIAKVQKAIGADAGIKQLREEMDKLKKENQELKSRLEAIEAKTVKG
ncbi:M1 family metallopeptidase [Pseudanabaena sp. PCC 6802]|uniref:M1 family metallopeptidase n=1 Tax=Pseudanabaena sp. PCC 6802 TaxID=118173 RepID=UPI00034718E3|nr:M1 family metallopeptidase [Pseudanabaena sp. PCC 6802]